MFRMPLYINKKAKQCCVWLSSFTSGNCFNFKDLPLLLGLTEFVWTIPPSCRTEIRLFAHSHL